MTAGQHSLCGVGVDSVVRGVLGSKWINLGQGGRCLAHIELAGDDIGDKAGAVFTQQFDLSLGSLLGSVYA